MDRPACFSLTAASTTPNPPSDIARQIFPVMVQRRIADRLSCSAVASEGYVVAATNDIRFQALGDDDLEVWCLIWFQAPDALLQHSIVILQSCHKVEVDEFCGIRRLVSFFDCAGLNSCPFFCCPGCFVDGALEPRFLWRMGLDIAFVLWAIVDVSVIVNFVSFGRREGCKSGGHCVVCFPTVRTCDSSPRSDHLSLSPREI